MKNRKLRKPLPSVQYIVDALDIDLENGTFLYKERLLKDFPDERIWKSWNSRFAGKPAGYIDSNGYLVIGIRREKFMAHRLLWKVATDGDEPIELDHIDRNPLNNRISNLRACSRSENNRNKRLSEFNTSGYRGIYLSKRSQKWVSQMKVSGRSYHLGIFETIDEAIAARQGAEKIFSVLS